MDFGNCVLAVTFKMLLMIKYTLNLIYRVGIWIKFYHIKALTSHEPNRHFRWFMSVSVIQPYCWQWLEHTTLLLQKVLIFLQAHNYTAFKTAWLLQKPPVNQPIKHNVSKRTKLIFELNLKQTGLYQSYNFSLET